MDGTAPSKVGDDAIWFLDAVGTEELPLSVAVSAQGRFLVADGALVGASSDDRLIDELAALTPDELTAAIGALPAAGA